ncbi:hypothetical protein M407DRAFT_8415 [Tulasnella calospora MUT 4182]|uniref:Uncharacterized protein n=1 Tax=Tulasnella calospora MUT 4182 TaxID=1051891 RepID=A0A0C3QHX9_9AGAM|nr:hypothetical protein M407DRAFT_8415 [Tulasnella calospora MUT 4182]
MAFKTPASRSPQNLSSSLTASATPTNTGVSASLGHFDTRLPAASSPTRTPMLSFSVTSGPIGPCVLCRVNPAIAAIFLLCQHVVCANHLTYFQHVSPDSGLSAQAGPEGYTDPMIPNPPAAPPTLHTHFRNGLFSQPHEQRNQVRRDTAGPPRGGTEATDAISSEAQIAPPSSQTKGKLKEETITQSLTWSLVFNSPSTGFSVPRIVHQDPGPSAISSFAGGLTSSARSPPVSSESTGSSSDSTYGSWTSEEAAEAHAIAARFETLAIRKEAEARAQEALNSIYSDNMDIVHHDEE